MYLRGVRRFRIWWGQCPQLKAVKNKNFVKICREQVPMSPYFPALLNQYIWSNTEELKWEGEVSKHNITARCEVYLFKLNNSYVIPSVFSVSKCQFIEYEWSHILLCAYLKNIKIKISVQMYNDKNFNSSRSTVTYVA